MRFFCKDFPKIPPGPPIPTAFDMCVSVEEQILWLHEKVKDLENRIEKLEKAPD